MGFFKSLFSSMGRTIGRILVYLIIGLIIMFLLGDKVHAQTFTGSDLTLNDTYYDLFSGYLDNMAFDENYVAYSYNCSSSSSYSQTCYAMCIGDITNSNNKFTGSCRTLVKYDYVGNNRIITTESDNNFNFTGDIYYSDLGNSSTLGGDFSKYEKMVILFIAICICNYIISRLFFKR